MSQGNITVTGETRQGASAEGGSPGVTTVGRWFGLADRPLLGWLSTPAAGLGESGVLVLPPVGYAYWSSHRTLRVIAERLAAAGHGAMRIDYDGTGDSAGDQSDGERLAAWRASVAAAVSELRRLGCRRLVIVGVRLGGTLALLDGVSLEADAVVAWAPVVSGRRYTKEIRLLATDVPAGESEWPDGTLVAAGCVYLPQTIGDLAAIGLADIAKAPAPRVLLLDGGTDAPELAKRLRSLGVEVDEREIADGAQALEVPSEYATVPDDLVAAIAQWVGPATGESSGPLEPSSSARFESGGTVVQEEVIELGEERLVGILTEPLAVRDGAATVVMLDTGSEPHIGPGRAWVEYARLLAADGHRCLRVDFRGWGESPDDGFAPGRPYDEHCVEDAAAVIRALRARAHDRIVLLGLCASAWVALRVVLDEEVAGVIALNPQLYWQPGDPVEATMAETRLRRRAERARDERGGRCGVWTALDLLGSRPRAGRWLDQLAAQETPIALVFAAGDDGVEYLHNRLARRLEQALRAGPIRVVEVTGIDHAMSRAWLRPRLVAVIREQLRIIGGEAA